MTRSRTAGLVVVLALILSIRMSAHAGSLESALDVGCDEAVALVEFPYEPRKYQLVLGVASVPRGDRLQIVRIGRDRWRYWRKTPLIVRGGAPVTVSVPRPWRDRVAIEWGFSDRAVGSVRIKGCPPPASGAADGRVYTGGFFLKPSSACVPLLFRVGDRAATVRFALGKRCSPRS